MEIKVEHVCLNKWRKRVDAAEKRGRFSDSEMNQSLSWKFCAVGEGRFLIPKKARETLFSGVTVNPEPIDYKLTMLGSDFPDLVCGNDFKGARKQLDRIEKRLDVLVGQFVRKANKTLAHKGAI